MRCPACIEKNLLSKVYDSKTTASGHKAILFYDENGHRHRHDPDTVSRFFKCGNDHKFVVITQGSCWCGWNKHARPVIEVILPPVEIGGPSIFRKITDLDVVSKSLAGSSGPSHMES